MSNVNADFWVSLEMWEGVTQESLSITMIPTLLANLNTYLEGGKDLCLFLLSSSRAGHLPRLELAFFVSSK